MFLFSNTQSTQSTMSTQGKVCFICTDKFTERLRMEVKCPGCGSSWCLQCIKAYILTEREGDENKIVCFNTECRREFDLDFLSSFLSADFIKKYVLPKITNAHKAHQYALMGETQHYMKHLVEMKEWRTGIRDIGYGIIDELKQRIRDVQFNIQTTKPVYDKSKLKGNIFKCPTSSCRGHVSINGECGLCNKRFCTECMELEEEGHVCKKETLESLKMIRENSKPCPHCNMFISKIDGCNQMWCFNCKGFWDWSSGKKIEIVTRTQIHNPEFLRHERENLGANIRVDLLPCDTVPDTAWKYSDDLLKSNFIRNHFGNYSYATYVYDPIHKSNNWLRCYEQKEDRYLKSRIKYLEGKMTKKDFEKKIQQLKLMEIKDNKMAEFLHEFIVQKRNIIRNFLDISEVFVKYEKDIHGKSLYQSGIFLGFVKLYITIKENYNLDLYYSDLIKKLHSKYGYKTSFSFVEYSNLRKTIRDIYCKMQNWEPSYFSIKEDRHYKHIILWKEEWNASPENLDKFIEENKISTMVDPRNKESWYHSIV